VPAGARRIEVTFSHALSPVQSTMINSCLREMSRHFDFNIKTLKRCTISRETSVTEPYFESKDLLKDLGFVKRRWSVAEVLVKQHHIEFGKCEQLLEERAQLQEAIPDYNDVLGSMFLRHLNVLFFAGVGVDPLEMAAAASR